MAIPSIDSQQGQGVRTLFAGDVAAKIVDATTPSQGLGVDTSGRITIKLDDGNGNIVTSQVSGTQRALDVGINVAGVQIDPRLIRALTATDVVTSRVQDGTGTAITSTLISSKQGLDVNVIDQVTVNQGTNPWITLDLADGSVAPGTAGTKSMLGGGLYNSAGVTLTNGQQAALQLNATGALITRLLTDSDRISADLNVNGAPNTVTNPVFVSLTSALPGTQIQNYFMSATNLAYGASDTHTYSITTGKTFNIKKIWAAASGRIRIDVATSPDGTTFTTVYTAYNSTTTPNIAIDFDVFSLQDSGTGAQVRITRYNEEFGQTFGISSTIAGTEN